MCEHCDFERGSDKEDNEQSQKFEGKLKSFKNCPFCANHAIFPTESSREQVARTLKTKILKNLSKCFSRLEVLPVRESRGKP